MPRKLYGAAKAAHAKRMARKKSGSRKRKGVYARSWKAPTRSAKFVGPRRPRKARKARKSVYARSWKAPSRSAKFIGPRRPPKARKARKARKGCCKAVKSVRRFHSEIGNTYELRLVAMSAKCGRKSRGRRGRKGRR